MVCKDGGEEISYTKWLKDLPPFARRKINEHFSKKKVYTCKEIIKLINGWKLIGEPKSVVNITCDRIIKEIKARK